MIGSWPALAQPVGDPPPVSSAAWFTWYDQLLAERIACCPRDRAQTFYFSQSGDDATGDGSITNPYRTLAKAQQILGSHPGGDVALLFRRGDTWRQSVGISTGVPDITIADYGTGAKPLLTPFRSVGDPSLWSPTAGRLNTFERPEPGPITWVKEDDDLDVPYSRQASVGGVEANIGSWFWDQAAGVLSIHPKHGVGGVATDPRTDAKAYEVVGPTDWGLRIAGDGSRIENIRAVGWGMQQTTPSQKEGISSRVSGSDRALFIGCESFYGSSHAMAHWSTQGGVATFIDCQAGLTTFNGGNGETVFNTFARRGGNQTIFDQCRATQGTLPSSDWGYAFERRGRGFFGHTGGLPTDLLGLTILNDCVTLVDHPRGCSNPSNFNNAPPAPDLAAVRVFIVGEVFQGGPGTGIGLTLAPGNAARVNGRYLNMNPPPGTSRALVGFRQQGWVINCTFELDASNQSTRFAFYDALPGQSSRPRLFNCRFDLRAPPGATISIDRDIPNQSADAAMVDSIFADDSPGSALPNIGNLLSNAYFNVDPIDYAIDSQPIVLSEAPPMDALPSCASPLVCVAADLPEAISLEFDQTGRAVLRRDVGPIESGACADQDGDGTISVADFFAFVSAFASSDPVADLDDDGLVGVLDFFLFVTAFAADCP